MLSEKSLKMIWSEIISISGGAAKLSLGLYRTITTYDLNMIGIPATYSSSLFVNEWLQRRDENISTNI